MRRILACLALGASAFMHTPQRVGRIQSKLRSTEVASDWEDDLREAIRIAEAREAFASGNPEAAGRRGMFIACASK